jgi:hypothetical protein
VHSIGAAAVAIVAIAVIAVNMCGVFIGLSVLVGNYKIG